MRQLVPGILIVISATVLACWLTHPRLHKGDLDTETWLIVGVDPQRTGINSEVARFKRHWLHRMFMDPESVRATLNPPVTLPK